jgi:hypothetical protein
MKPDLTLLYSELGLKPNCSLAELQLAYRRRISELQPRTADRVSTPESTAALRNLIGLYTTANRFHRRYGRLPGAAPNRAQAVHASHAVVYRPRADYAPPSDSHESPSPRIALALTILLLVLLFVLLALASGEWLR